MKSRSSCTGRRRSWRATGRDAGRPWGARGSSRCSSPRSPLSYYGHYGPLSKPALAFPCGSLVEVGVAVAAYYWAAASGFEIEEIHDVVAAHRAPPMGAGRTVSALPSR